MTTELHLYLPQQKLLNCASIWSACCTKLTALDEEITLSLLVQNTRISSPSSSKCSHWNTENLN